MVGCPASEALPYVSCFTQSSRYVVLPPDVFRWTVPTRRPSAHLYPVVSSSCVGMVALLPHRSSLVKMKQDIRSMSGVRCPVSVGLVLRCPAVSGVRRCLVSGVRRCPMSGVCWSCLAVSGVRSELIFAQQFSNFLSFEKTFIVMAVCRCDVCDGSQDDGRRTVSEQSVQRITSKETAQT